MGYVIKRILDKKILIPTYSNLKMFNRFVGVPYSNNALPFTNYLLPNFNYIFLNNLRYNITTNEYQTLPYLNRNILDVIETETHYFILDNMDGLYMSNKDNINNRTLLNIYPNFIHFYNILYCVYNNRIEHYDINGNYITTIYLNYNLNLSPSDIYYRYFYEKNYLYIGGNFFMPRGVYRINLDNGERTLVFSSHNIYQPIYSVLKINNYIYYTTWIYDYKLFKFDIDKNTHQLLGSFYGTTIVNNYTKRFLIIFEGNDLILFDIVTDTIYAYFYGQPSLIRTGCNLDFIYTIGQKIDIRNL